MQSITETMLASRRGFLIGSGGLLIAEPKLIFSTVPVLWGDGVHDDTDALNALLSGKPVKAADSGDTFRSLFEDGWAALKGGRYRIGGTLRPCVPFYLTGATFIQDGPTRPMFEAGWSRRATSGQWDAVITHCTFIIPPPPPRDMFNTPAAAGLAGRHAIDFDDITYHGAT